MLEGNKSIFLSTTFYGVVISVVAVVLNMFGIQLNDQAGWVNDVAALVGAVVALVGRVKAVKKIGMFAAFMIAVLAMGSVQAAPPDSWSRNEWKYIEKTAKVAVYRLVTDSDGVASGEALTGVGPDLPENAIVTNVYYHIANAFSGASDNQIDLSCIASGDLMNNVQLHNDTVNTVASGGVVDADNPSTYVKTTTTGCSPQFEIGSGTTGYASDAQLDVMVEFIQLSPSEGLSE